MPASRRVTRAVNEVLDLAPRRGEVSLARLVDAVAGDRGRPIELKMADLPAGVCGQWRQYARPRRLPDPEGPSRRRPHPRSRAWSPGSGSRGHLRRRGGPRQHRTRQLRSDRVHAQPADRLHGSQRRGPRAGGRGLRRAAHLSTRPTPVRSRRRSCRCGSERRLVDRLGDRRSARIGDRPAHRLGTRQQAVTRQRGHDPRAGQSRIRGRTELAAADPPDRHHAALAERIDRAQPGRLDHMCRGQLRDDHVGFVEPQACRPSDASRSSSTPSPPSSRR